MTIELLQQMTVVSEKQTDHLDFYDLAEKYGFCSPWCEDSDCSCREDSPVV